MKNREISKWLSIDYLKNGTKRQKELWDFLQRWQFLKKLEAYHPVVVGTFPIDIDVPGSDIDICCEVYDEKKLREDLSFIFENLSFPERNGYFLARTHCEGYDLEFYGEARPAVEQNGFRHMLVEARLLELGGEDFKNDIRDIKRRGIKTEAAFAQYLDLPGNPYQALLELEAYDDSDLSQFF